MEQTASQMSQMMEAYGAIALQYGLDTIGALLLVIFGWVVAGWIKRLVERGLMRLPQTDATVSRFLASIARYLVLIVVLIAVLAQFGVQTASILAVLGTAGLAIGLALQGTLSNIAAGVMLLFLRPIKVGEYVDAGGIAGTVDEVGLFSTQLTTFDGVYIQVPNGQIWNSAIKNYSRLPTRRVDVPVGVSYGDDIDKALGVLLSHLQSEPRVLAEPAPEVMVLALADSSVNLNMRCWTNAGDYWALRFDLTKAAKELVEAAGCTIPFPQRDVHVIAAPATNPQAASL